MDYQHLTHIKVCGAEHWNSETIQKVIWVFLG